MKEFAYHCTEVDPQLIIKDGFKATGKGFTGTNQVDHFYKEFLPANPMFVSKIDADVWDSKSKFCMKIDITGLEKFPDFGHLLDYGAYFDEECFWWEDDEQLKKWLSSGDSVEKRLADFVLNECDDGMLYAADFTGDLSFEILGTCAIDGSKLTVDRVAAVKSKA